VFSLLYCVITCCVPLLIVVSISYCKYHIIVVIMRSFIDISYSISSILYSLRLFSPVGVLTVPRQYFTEVSLDTYWVPLWCTHTTLLHHFCADPDTFGVSQSLASCTDLAGETQGKHVAAFAGFGVTL